MRRCVWLFAVAVFTLAAQEQTRAQDLLVPAGTLLRCTMDEPNFSSATAQVGDPVLCHLNNIQEFGRAVFPRGTYLGGHLEAEKEPGHFVGKGYLKIVFDRIGLPNTDIPLDTKVIGARGFHVDKDGDIIGKGHATRDVIEWMIPPLWPWKVIMLPARGPRPTLKGEETLTLRLMEDVVVPRAVASYDSNRPPRTFSNYTPQNFTSRPAARASSDVIRPATYVSSTDAMRSSSSPSADLTVASPASVSSSVQTATPVNATPETSKLTLIALRNETIYAVSNYWLDGDKLDYILPSGNRDSCDLNTVDLARTTQLNLERGITVTFRGAPQAEPALSSALN